MHKSRRSFLKQSSAVAAGFLSLRHFLSQGAYAEGGVDLDSDQNFGYGPLIPDAADLLDLPAGFSYRIVSRAGDAMSDGLLTPAMPDGMATFAGPDGLTILIRNHELRPCEGPGAFGDDDALAGKIDATKLYDRGASGGPIHRGGTTTIVYDTKNQRVVRHFLSLGGTVRNCAGGPTPWNTWISCEENVARAGYTVDFEHRFHSAVDHGYAFEVPATAEIRLHQAVPLTAMGRFHHEAVAVDSATSIVYETEDRDDGLLYRYLPAKPSQLAAGGRLQALCVRGEKSCDTRRWQELGDPGPIAMGERYPVEWLDVDGIDSPADDLRMRGFAAGAARFARGEGMWHSQGQVFFACTDGGVKKKGQIWRYLPSQDEGQPGERERPGMLELYLEPNDSRLLQGADNLTVAPWGDLVVCEDRQGKTVRLVGITPGGAMYPLANSHSKCEFAGSVFSPDGSTLFVNMQCAGITTAITGPWRVGS